MRKVTSEVTQAFLARRAKQVSNTATNGTRLTLHGSTIAEHRADGLYITTAGWNTRTTLDRLNALPGVAVRVKAGKLLLNGVPWSGDWALVD